MDQLPGQVFQNRYQIRSLLGRQTGRRTFLADDLQTGREVVIKLLLFGPDFTWDDLKLFEREAEVLRALDHPAIPHYLDYFEVETELGKGFALVQTFIQARSLQSWVEAGRSFSEADLKAIARSLLDILAYLHSRQPAVIHRDIKPSNCLLSDRLLSDRLLSDRLLSDRLLSDRLLSDHSGHSLLSDSLLSNHSGHSLLSDSLLSDSLLSDHSSHSLGHIYLIDFGSVQTAVQTGTRTIVGTYGYMPPEQFGGRSLAASDLYALGATLIYLATGQHPDQLPQRDMRIGFEDQVELSPELVDWLKWLTEPSVEQRPQSAQQALEALEHPGVRGPLAAQPLGSKIQLTQTRQRLEVLIPPLGFHLGLMPIIGFAIAWNGFLLVWYSISVAIWNSGGWIGAVFALGHLGVGLFLIWGILFTLFGKISLQITPSEILLTYRMLGLWCAPALRADRRALSKLELSPLTYRRDSDKGTIEVPPQIQLWAGTKKFVLGGKGQSGKDILAPPELEWLAQELSQWLKLPITR